MAKPKQNNEEAVSLFPFLSILACLIGVLTFIITGVAISQMDQSEDLAAVERIEKHAPLVDQIKQDQAALDQLRARHDVQSQLTQQIAQARQRRDELARLQQNKKQVDALKAQLSQVNQQINELKPELAQHNSKVKQSQAEIDRRIKANLAVGTVVRSSGSGVDLKPNFVECGPGYIVIHAGGKQTKVLHSKITKDPAYLGLLDRIAQLEKERVVFLLRPEGVGMYGLASRIARERRCRYGKIPVPGEGPIDLSNFDE